MAQEMEFEIELNKAKSERTLEKNIDKYRLNVFRVKNGAHVEAY